MEYKGKLYGKSGNIYFPLQETTEDVEALKQQIKYLKKQCNIPDVVNCNFINKNKLMDREEILKQAQAKLPNINECNLEKIIIPIVKPINNQIIDNVLPKPNSNTYEVYFEKYYRFVGDKATWRFMMITEA